MGTRGTFPVIKAEGLWSWSLTATYWRGQEWWSYTFPPHTFSWRGA
jgi:hypothetical protein